MVNQPRFMNMLTKGCANSIALIYFTSSAAQGDGGSFQDRKPIGEIGCCESRMAERIRMDRRVVGVVFFWSGCNGCSGHLTHNCWM